jgi:hypothetical protein
MTSSAGEWAGDSDWLGRTFELYRDLSVALRDRITCLTEGVGEDADGRKTLAKSIKDYQRILQTVLDHEGKIGRRSREWAGGNGELDLDAARAEIVARLSVWAAAR